MAHNWSHSFMSGMNYVDDGFVFEDVYELARTRRGAKVVINWIPATSEELFCLSPRVRKCVLAYRQGLEVHLQRHSIDAAALLAFRTEVYVEENFRMRVRSYVLDDRNKEHIAFVYS
jgi:hypothetical protein